MKPGENRIRRKKTVKKLFMKTCELEDSKFKASLEYKEKPCLTKQPNLTCV